MGNRLILVLALIFLPMGRGGVATAAIPADIAPTSTNEYPTTARADYVFACMNENGGTQDALRECSCAIDVIASLLPYKNYEQADTVLRMQRTTGYLAEEFQTDAAKNMVRNLWEAQAEATVRCF